MDDYYARLMQVQKFLSMIILSDAHDPTNGKPNMALTQSGIFDGSESNTNKGWQTLL